MFMANMKKLLQKRITLLPLSILVLMGSMVSTFILPTPSAYAASVDECIAQFDGKASKDPGENGVGGLPSKAVRDLANSSDCKAYCGVDGSKITCSKEYAESAPLIRLICDKSNSINCRSKVKDAYEICKDSKASEALTGIEIKFKTAGECFREIYKLGDGESMPSPSQLNKAFTDGEKSSNDVDKDQRTKCEADGKVWEDGECVAKEDPSSCNIDGIGWMVCPVMSFVGNIIDVTYSAVSELLTVRSTWSDGDDALYNAWAMARTFANVCFVIAFLIIIYSQITGAGITNYGIKKMLPRIIMAVILVNLSYQICAAAVDISNIVGSSVKGLFDTAAGNLSGKNAYVTSSGEHYGSWVGAIGLAMAATGVLMWTTIGVIAPLAVAALIAIITVLVVLVARQAIIIFLVVLAPLAFVALLLPNTQKWFDRWRDSFLAMLIMYPLVGLLFGASNLASYVLASTAGGQIGADDTSFASDTTMVILQLAALGVAVIPLVLTPFIIKMSTGILGKIGSFVNNPNRGPLDGLRKRADGFRDNRVDSRRGKQFGMTKHVMNSDKKLYGAKNSRRRKVLANIIGGKSARDSARNQRYQFTKAVADESAQEYLANRAINDPGFAIKQAGGDANKAISVQASAQGAVDKILQQDTANRKILYEAEVRIRENPAKELEKALKSGDEVGIRALGSMLKEGGSSGYEKFNQAIQNYQDTNKGGSPETIEAAKKFVSDNGKDFIAKDPALVTWAKGGFDQKDEAGNVISRASLSEGMSRSGSVKRTDEQLAGITSEAMRHAVSSNSISVEQAKSMLSNPQIVKETSIDNQESLRAVIASGGNVTVTPADRAGVSSEAEALKIAVQRLASTAPTVEQIQQTTNTPAVSQNATANDNSSSSNSQTYELKIDHPETSIPQSAPIKNSGTNPTFQSVRPAPERGPLKSSDATNTSPQFPRN